jgi:hypothetical protein
MALSDLIAQVQDNVQDPSGLRWSQQQITNYLNYAQTEIQQFSRALSSFATAVAASTDYVTRPPSLLVPYKALFEFDSNYQWELGFNSGAPTDVNTITGIPQDAYFAGSLIYLRPVPGQAGTLTVVGTVRAVPMVNSTDAPTYDGSDQVLVAYATWYCFMTDNDPAAEGWYQRYMQMRAEWSVLEAEKNPTNNRIWREWWQ